MTEVRLFAGLVGLSLALSGAASCAHVQAAQPAPSVLDVPSPPPRVVVPPSDRLMDPPEDPPAPTMTPPPSARPTPAPPRQADKPATSSTTTAAPPPVDPATPPPLETTANTSALQTDTQTLLDNANHDLTRVDFGALSSDAKAQYMRVKSFMKQAQDALHEKNLTYARNMAEKAAALASQLPKTKGLTDSDSSASVL